jgi:hypothetical protein
MPKTQPKQAETEDLQASILPNALQNVSDSKRREFKSQIETLAELRVTRDNIGEVTERFKDYFLTLDTQLQDNYAMAESIAGEEYDATHNFLQKEKEAIRSYGKQNFKEIQRRRGEPLNLQKNRDHCYDAFKNAWKVLTWLKLKENAWAIYSSKLEAFIERELQDMVDQRAARRTLDLVEELFDAKDEELEAKLQNKLSEKANREDLGELEERIDSELRDDDRWDDLGRLAEVAGRSQEMLTEEREKNKELREENQRLRNLLRNMGVSPPDELEEANTEEEVEELKSMVAEIKRAVKNQSFEEELSEASEEPDDQGVEDQTEEDDLGFLEEEGQGEGQEEQDGNQQDTGEGSEELDPDGSEAERQAGEDDEEEEENEDEEDEEEELVCPECGRDFDLKPNMETHMQFKHDISDQNLDRTFELEGREASTIVERLNEMFDVYDVEDMDRETVAGLTDVDLDRLKKLMKVAKATADDPNFEDPIEKLNA